jgi:hypothetical protein
MRMRTSLPLYLCDVGPTALTYQAALNAPCSSSLRRPLELLCPAGVLAKIGRFAVEFGKSFGAFRSYVGLSMGRRLIVAGLLSKMREDGQDTDRGSRLASIQSCP